MIVRSLSCENLREIGENFVLRSNNASFAEAYFCLWSARQQAETDLRSCRKTTSQDQGTRLGFLLGHTGVLAVTAVIHNDLRDGVSSKAGDTSDFKDKLFIFDDFINCMT